MSWMISEGIIHGTTSSPQRRDVAGWVDRAMTEMKEEVGIIRNAWSKIGYKWFANEGRVCCNYKLPTKLIQVY